MGMPQWAAPMFPTEPPTQKSNVWKNVLLVFGVVVFFAIVSVLIWYFGFKQPEDEAAAAAAAAAAAKKKADEAAAAALAAKGGTGTTGTGAAEGSTTATSPTTATTPTTTSTPAATTGPTEAEKANMVKSGDVIRLRNKENTGYMGICGWLAENKVANVASRSTEPAENIKWTIEKVSAKAGDVIKGGDKVRLTSATPLPGVERTLNAPFAFSLFGFLFPTTGINVEVGSGDSTVSWDLVRIDKAKTPIKYGDEVSLQAQYENKTYTIGGWGIHPMCKDFRNVTAVVGTEGAAESTWTVSKAP